MKTQEIEFFNVAELRDGVIYRFPECVCNALNIPEFDAQGRFLRLYSGHRAAARSSYGVELRFVTEAKKLTVCMQSDRPFLLTAYNGDFQCGFLSAQAGKTEWELSRNVALKGLDARLQHRFSKNVWRIAAEGDGDIRLLEVRTENGERLRAPSAEEEPAFRLLAYGSSISQGVGTPFPQLNYLNTAAQILGIDILNKAISGGCFCERETVEYLCGEQFDAVCLEPGTNIADRPPEVIEDRVGHLIDTFCLRFPDKKIFVLTPVRGLSDVSSTASDYRDNFAKSRKVITEHAAKHKNVILLDGHALLSEGYFLAADLLHPSAFGHVCMGHRLTDMLKKYLTEGEDA